MDKKNGPASREEYFFFSDIVTRWSDNDIYGHINSVVYYAYFDSIANRFLIERAGLDIHHGDTVGFVVSSGCNYFKPAAYPDALTGGFRVNHLGNSSVEYGLAIFREDEPESLVVGHFTHVFVDRETNKPRAIEGRLRNALESAAN